MRTCLLILLAAAAILPGVVQAKPYSSMVFNGGRYPYYVNGQKFMIGLSKKYDVIVMQAPLGSGGASSATPIQTWRKAAESFVKPLGCGINVVEAMSVMGGTWQATYLCPDGVNLWRMAETHKAVLKTGAGFPDMQDAGTGTARIAE